MIAFIMTISSFGQSSRDSLSKIAPELLKQDFIVFRDSLQKLHAGNHPIIAIAYYVVFSYLVSAIEDGHTSCALPPEETGGGYYGNTSVG